MEEPTKNNVGVMVQYRIDSNFYVTAAWGGCGVWHRVEVSVVRVCTVGVAVGGVVPLPVPAPRGARGAPGRSGFLDFAVFGFLDRFFELFAERLSMRFVVW